MSDHKLSNAISTLPRIEILEEKLEQVANVAAGAAIAAAAGAGLTTFSEFFGLTTGTGNAGANDYAATVAVKTVAGSGRVPFPRNGAIQAPTVGQQIVRVDATSFVLPSAGIYLVQFFLHTTEPGQIQVELGGANLADTVAVNDNPTAGGHPLVGCSLVTATAGQIIAIINCPGNAAALTVTPADGSRTAANAGRLVIARLI